MERRVRFDLQLMITRLKLYEKITFWEFNFLFFYGVLIFLYYLRAFRVDLTNAVEDFYSMAFIVAWIIIGLFIYLTAYKHINFSTVSIKQIFLYSIFFSALLLPLLPLTSSDLYNYVSRGRILSLFSENPYLVPYNNFQNDEYFYILQTVWSKDTPVYGPFFTLISAFLAYIARKNIFVTFFIFKLFFSALSIANSYLVYRLTLSKKALFLSAWNPFFIFEFSLNAHNDALLIFLILLSLLVLKEKRKVFGEIAGFAFLVLSALVKLFGTVFIPFYLIHIVSRHKKLVSKFKVFFFSIFLGILLILITYFPFLERTVFLKRLSEISNYTNIFASPLVLFAYLIFKLVGVKDYLFWGKIGSKLLFLIIYLFLLIRFFFDSRRSDFSQFLHASVLVIGIFLFTALNWFMAWYVILLATLMIVSLGANFRLKHAYFLVGLSIYGLWQYILTR